MAKKKSAKPTELTGATLRRVKLLFAPKDRAEAARLLSEQCGNNLPFLEDATPAELGRFRYAALRLSRGNLRRLRWAINMGKLDWRDLLVTAGFGDDEKAHRRWLPKSRFKAPRRQTVSSRFRTLRLCVVGRTMPTSVVFSSACWLTRRFPQDLL